MDRDGDLDPVLHFRTEDTNLRSLYEQLLAADGNADGVLDSTHQELSVSLTGETSDGTCFLGSDTLDHWPGGAGLDV